MMKVILPICIIICALLFQPNFHKPPIEFQSPLLRCCVQFGFGLSLTASVFLLLVMWVRKNKSRKVAAIIMGSFMTLFSLLEIVFTLLNAGNTYQNREIYVNEKTGEQLVWQYYGHGGLGSSSRMVKQTPIYGNIHYIEYGKLTNGIWKVYDVNSTLLRIDTIENN